MFKSSKTKSPTRAGIAGTINPASIVGILSPAFTGNKSVILVSGSLSESSPPSSVGLPDCWVGSYPIGVLNITLYKPLGASIVKLYLPSSSVTVVCKVFPAASCSFTITLGIPGSPLS